MRKFFISILLLISLMEADLLSRGRQESSSFWNLNYWGGFIGLENNYYYQATTLKSGFSERQRTSQFNGLFSLDTESFIIHPNFLLFDLGVLFRPGTRSDNFIVAPDQAQTATAERINFRTDLFQQRSVNGNFYFNYDHSFIRRDFTTNIENFRKNLGASANFRNPIVNINFNYDYNNWRQNEIEFNRFYKSIRHNFSALANQSFGTNFTNRLKLNFSDFLWKYSTNYDLIARKIFDANLNTRILLNTPIPINYNSLILYNNQYGYERINKFQILQRVSTDLPSNFRLSGDYNYNYFKISRISSITNKINLGLVHQLYNSLRTNVNLRFSDYDQTMYSQKDNDFEIGFNYTKNIVIGNLNLSYTYNRFGRSTESLSNVISIFNEPHLLTDGTIELLFNPDVFTNSIVVTDENNAVVYQENFDYEIIQQRNFTQIRRVIGGQISNGERVLVSYSILRNSSYKYVSNSNRFFAGINFFNNFIQVSYSGNEVNFDNLENVNYVVLKLISQRIITFSLNFWGFSTGIEFDNFKSNIVPYESQRYFVRYNNQLSNSTLFSVSANYKDIYLNANRQRQTFADGVGSLMFFLSTESKLLFEGSYRFQRGYGLDLELLKFKSELQIGFRAIQIALGAEILHRTFIQEKKDFFNGYVTIQRNF